MAIKQECERGTREEVAELPGLRGGNTDENMWVICDGMVLGKVYRGRCRECLVASEISRWFAKQFRRIGKSRRDDRGISWKFPRQISCRTIRQKKKKKKEIFVLAFRPLTYQFLAKRNHSFVFDFNSTLINNLLKVCKLFESS